MLRMPFCAPSTSQSAFSNLPFTLAEIDSFADSIHFWKLDTSFGIYTKNQTYKRKGPTEQE